MEVEIICFILVGKFVRWFNILVILLKALIFLSIIILECYNVRYKGEEKM